MWWKNRFEDRVELTFDATQALVDRIQALVNPSFYLLQTLFDGGQALVKPLFDGGQALVKSLLQLIEQSFEVALIEPRRAKAGKDQRDDGDGRRDDCNIGTHTNDEYSVVALACQRKPQGREQRRMLTTLSRWIARTFFREVVIEGREHLPLAGPVIFTPNHPNALLDPLLLQFLSPPFRLRFVAKEPLFRLPVFGWILRWAGAIPVVRRLDVQGEVDYTAFFAAGVDALVAGDSLVIFPEGRSLPQPYMAPLRTGAARLFFMAHDKGVDPRIVPVGLNYERGAIFRTSVLVSIAPPLDTTASVEQYRTDPPGAVRELTAAIGRSLAHHVFQAETYRDRELLLLLERLYANDQSDDSWPQRVARLKQFEAGLARLREHCPREIERLRHRLARYERLSITFNVRAESQGKLSGSWLTRVVLGTTGWAIAGIGWLLNWLPYRLCGSLVRLTKRDEAAAATFKIAYALFLFPLAYVTEGWLIARWLGEALAVVLAALIIPLSYFTLLFFEWREELGRRSTAPSAWFAGNASRRVAEHLARLQQRIVAEVDALAARPELNIDSPDSAATPR